jgi:putative FmdB family regulatory protein
MPTYDYECPGCGLEFERFQSMSSPPIRACPSCSGRPRRKIGRGGALIFKGSGFYETDYKVKAKPKKAVVEG